jgi:hypothetical protein
LGIRFDSGLIAVPPAPTFSFSGSFVGLAGEAIVPGHAPGGHFRVQDAYSQCAAPEIEASRQGYSPRYPTDVSRKRDRDFALIVTDGECAVWSSIADRRNGSPDQTRMATEIPTGFPGTAMK